MSPQREKIQKNAHSIESHIAWEGKETSLKLNDSIAA